MVRRVPSDQPVLPRLVLQVGSVTFSVVTVVEVEGFIGIQSHGLRLVICQSIMCHILFCLFDNKIMIKTF